MKKAIIILSVFAVMVGAMIAELIFVNKFYNSLQAELEVVAESIELNESNVSNAETVALCEKVAGKWEKGKRTLLMLQNRAQPLRKDSQPHGGCQVGQLQRRGHIRAVGYKLCGRHTA